MTVWELCENNKRENLNSTVNKVTFKRYLLHKNTLASVTELPLSLLGTLGNMRGS